MKRKTKQKGETHTGSKLTVAKVKQMRTLRKKSKLPAQSLAARFKVSKSTVYRICNNTGWKGI